jgi:hypothetical protein
MANLNINQFQQVAVRGDIDLNINDSGVITGQVSANQATPLVGGTFVKLDSANTGPIPQFVAAAVGDANIIGVIKRNVKSDSFATGQYVEILSNLGPVMYLVAGATVASGAQVQDNGDGTVVTKSANAARGIALDPGTTGNLFRVIITQPVY